MRILVVYYSRSGNTRDVAEHVAAKLGADIAQIRSSRYRLGAASYVGAALDSWRGAVPAIEIKGPSPERYDLVLLLAPVWTGRPSAPMRAYLIQNKGKLRHAAFVLTCIGWCPPRAFEEMSALAGVKSAASFVLRESEIKAAAGLPASLSSYVATLKRSQAAQLSSR